MYVISDAQSERLDAAFFALSDRTRREILQHVVGGTSSVGELTERFAISQPAISRHLKVLEKAGLIRRSRDAQRRPAVVEQQPIAEVAAWLERYRETWQHNYARLDDALSEHMKGTRP